MYKIGISTCGGKAINQESFLAMKAAGIDAAEICLADYSATDFKKVRADADAAGIELFSIHSHTHPSFDISSLDKESNKRAVGEFCWLIDRISEIEMDKIVIHPTHTPEPFDQSERPEKIKRAMECLDILADYAYERGVWVALENLPRTCLDLNHSLIDDTASVIKGLGDKIITIHVSDRDNINERHWMPGEGVLDWKRIIDAFESIGYTGAWIYEIGFNASQTIARRPLTYSDFVTNAKEIFAGKDLTTIGVPFPNLGLWG